MGIRNEVKPDDIKANIYDTIRFIVDLRGVSTDGMEKSDISISKLLDNKIYNRIEDSYTYDEINDWDKRNNRTISNKMKQRIIETETVIRYISKDNTEIINLCKNYIELKLNYSKSFVLKEKMDLLQKIVNAYALNNTFIQLDNIILIKNNTIICRTIYALYRCFCAKQFGDIKSGLVNKDAFFAEYNSNSIIVLDEYNLIVQKEIAAGTYNKKVAYMGKLNFLISHSADKDLRTLDIKETLTKMNSCLFGVFIRHLTISFLNDLIKGETDKVLRGFKKNG